MDRIKITYLFDFLRTDQAGTEKQLMILIKHLPRECFSINLVSFQRSEFLEKFSSFVDDVDVTILDGQSDISKSIPSLWRLCRILCLKKPDILHTFFPASNSFGVMIGRLSGIRKIISSRRDMGYWQTRKDLFITRLANRWVTRIVANSLVVRENVLKTEGVPEDRVLVIHNALVMEKPFEKANRINGKKGPVVAIVANLNHPVKRVDLFIKAANFVMKDHPETTFWILGDGPLRAELEQLVLALKLDQNLVFMGRRPDVKEILRQVDVGVISSDSEGLSNAVMEYMVAGLPAVATDVGGNRELVKDGETGFLVPPGDARALSDAILALIVDPDLRIRMGSKGKAQVERDFALEKSLREWCDLYTVLMN